MTQLPSSPPQRVQDRALRVSCDTFGDPIYRHGDCNVVFFHGSNCICTEQTSELSCWPLWAAAEPLSLFRLQSITISGDKKCYRIASTITSKIDLPPYCPLVLVKTLVTSQKSAPITGQTKAKSCFFCNAEI